MTPDIELVRLLARLKLQVRRVLNQAVDLEKLAGDANYAKQRLTEIENQTEDEELLVTLITLRARLLPDGTQTLLLQGEPAQNKPRTPSKYMFGARS
ncbi:hypothetical protein [Chitinivorax sp. B]|uniref:hypothetical protein n=1 Tax=Chitinivorax sp. B TaxID=2502235 RepID=UPI0010F6E228|nr:hypothetical protein [Chitinivorax sp. B]